MRLPECMILESRRTATRRAAEDWEWSLQWVGIPGLSTIHSGYHSYQKDALALRLSEC